MEIERISNEKISFNMPDDTGWINLRIASNFDYPELENVKGVYIIKNATKNIYYVGQSKNMRTRFGNHFKNGDVKNIKFAKDWYSDDDFFYKYFICDTKDELDDMEREYISKYNSFENGYNATGGNS